jgi:hypothetical protein
MPSLTPPPTILDPSPRPSVMGSRLAASGRVARHIAARAPLQIALLLAAALLAAACSGRSLGTGTPDLPPACDAFVAKYEACLSAEIPSLPSLAKERAAQTRAALENEAGRIGTAATRTNPTNRAALETKCNANLQRLTASCSSPHTH